jgi:hypothetical protein
MDLLREKRRLLASGGYLDMGGGGGGGGGNTGSQTNVTELPEWAKPYAQKTLAKGEALTETPYQTYNAPRIAGFSDLQTNAQNQAAGMTTAPQLDTATQMAQAAGQAGLSAAYRPGYFGNQFRSPGQYTPSQFAMMQAQAPELQQYQMGPAERVSAMGVGTPEMQGAQTGFAPNLQQFQMGPAQQVGTQAYTGENVSQYMSPYMQNVVDIQQREARRASDIAAQGQRAQAVGAGAFGGSRQGLVEAERQRNLATQLGDIQATGQQAAFQNAQQQFNQQQQANMQAALANQAAGLTVGQQNLGAQLGVQQLGTQTGLQTALANLNNQQQANVQNQAAQLQAQGMNATQALQAALANQQAGLSTGQQNLAAQLGVQQLGAGQDLQSQLANQQMLQSAQQAAEQSRQFGAGQAMTAAQQRAQYGLAGQQLGEQSRQYGAGLGMQGAGIGLQAAGALGNLGQTQYGQMMGINQLQNQYGAQQQALQQQGLSQAYQDFLNQQNYPYKQLGFMSDLIRGLPLGQQSTAQVYQGPGSLTGQLAGLGMGAYGLSRAFSMAEGGSVESESNIAEIVGKLSDAQLEQAKQAAKARNDFEQLQAIEVEQSMRASERGGMAGAFNSLPYDRQESMMAGGGIVAFADGDLVYSPEGVPVTGAETTQGDDLTMMERLGIFNPENRRAIEKAEAQQRQTQAAKTAKPGERSEADKKLIAEAQRKMEAEAAKPAPAKEQPAKAAAPRAEPAPQASSLEAEYNKFLAQNKALSDAYREEQKADRAAQQARIDETRKQAGIDAITQYGFKMAAEAAKPGARFLGSAASAAPTISDVLAASKKTENAMLDNLANMKRDDARFNMAVSKNDMASALSIANALRQEKKDQETLNLERQKLGIMAQQASQSGITPILQIASKLQAADPNLTTKQAITEAAQAAGYSFRSEAAQQSKLNDARQKIEKEYAMAAYLPQESDLFKRMMAEKQRRLAELSNAPAPAQAAVSGMKIVDVR